jgi:hypothetical protein
MGLIWATAVIVSAFGSGADVPIQQGDRQGIYQSSAIQQVEQRLGLYLNGEMLKSILTPGEVVEWKIDLKAGQVVVAEAVSESFDPALEIVDALGKIYTQNDDRYPGDQRPLVFWRAEAGGAYLLRVRCFQNKAGGQVLARFNTYDTLDLSSGKVEDETFDATRPFLVRVPMKAGQVNDFVTERMGEGNYLNYRLNLAIFPNGLPERAPSLGETVSPAIRALAAPLAGDYYLMYTPFGYRSGKGRVRIGTREFVPKKLEPQGAAYVSQAPTNTPALFELSVKAGDLLEASTPELTLNSTLKVAEAPDLAKFSLDPKKPEQNPFFPTVKNQPPDVEPALDFLPSRRGGRIAVFRARRDAKLWLATDGIGPADKTFMLRVKPAAEDFIENKPNVGKLKVGKYDYWAFEAKAGDVMTFNVATAAFNQVVVVRDPDLGEVRHAEAPLDQTQDSWRMVIQKPGRYLIQYSCLGDGGGGDYTLSRSVLAAKEFTMAKPAKGEIADGEIQIWKFTATPNEPLFVRWNSSNWSYNLAIYDDKGNATDFQRQDIDGHNRLGILKVSEPRTYVIMLVGSKDKASYSIELSPIPAGLRK